MAEGRSKALWQHTSHVLAIICEINRNHDKRKNPFTAADFNPHVKRTQTTDKPVKTVTMRELHGLIPDLPQLLAKIPMRKKQE
jgi:hypothetical protein